MPEIPLHVLVAAVRAHPPTAKVVQEWLRIGCNNGHEINYIVEGRDTATYIPTDAARLIVEACARRHDERGTPERGILGWQDHARRYFAEQYMVPYSIRYFGDDYLAAFCWAHGVHLPGGEGEHG